MLKFAKGGKTGKAPTRTPDSLNSTDTVEVLIGISEGPIKGLVDGPKSFRADDTPLVSSTDEPNFQNFGLDVWPGSEMGHTIKLDLGGFSSPINIGVNLAKNVPVVRSGFIKGIDAADFRILVQQLVEQNDKGTFKNTLSLKFEVKRKTDTSWSPGWIASPGNIPPRPGTGTGSGGTGEAGGGGDVTDRRTFDVLNFANEPIDNGDYLSWRSFGSGNNVQSFAGDSQLTALSTANPTTPPADPTLPSIGVNMNAATNVVVAFVWSPETTSWVSTPIGPGSFSRPLSDLNRTLHVLGEAAPTGQVGDLWLKAYTELLVFNGVAWVQGIENTQFEPVLNQSGVWTITEKTTASTAKDIRVFLPDPGPNDEWEFRVTKLSDDSGTEKFSEVAWESVQEISRKPMVLRGVALARVIGRASDQFTSLPTWNGDWLGRIVKIPSNYDPVARTYTGVWDGTYKIDWTDNAAYIFQDFVENDRYGLSSVYPHIVNKWKIYEWGRHNDTMVLRPDGTLRPRWTYNDYIQQARDAKELAQYIAGSAGARYVDDGNGIVEVIIDKDDPAVAIFTNENIGEDGFSYSYTDRLTRANEITVEFVNPSLNWNNDKRIVKDDADIAIYGRIPENFIAVGCIDVDEAEARARRRLIGGLTEKEINTFTTNRKGKFLAEWNVILCGDADMGRGLTGRIREVTGPRSVSLRDPLSFEPGITYWATFDIVNPDYPEASADPFRVERRQITNPAGVGYTTLTFATDLPDLPEYASFILEAPDVLGFPKPYRITNIQDDSGSGDMIRITCLELNRNKWDFIDTGEEQDEIVYTNFASGVVVAPTNAKLIPSIRPRGAAATRVLTVAWDRSASQWVRRYKVFHAMDGVPQPSFDTTDLQIEVEGAEVGYHTFAIVAVDVRGRESLPLSIAYNVVGEELPSNRPRDFQLVNGTTTTRFDTVDATFAWNPPPLNPAFSHYRIKVKHKFLLGGDTQAPQDDMTIYTIVREVDNIADTTWTYGFPEQKADQDAGQEPDTARRDFIVELYAVDQFGAESAPAVLEVTNDPPTPVDVLVTATPLALYFQYPRPAEIDFAGIAIWLSETSGFDPEEVEPKWKNAGNPTIAAQPVQEYFYRYAFYDEFGMNGVVISDEFSITTPAAVFEATLPDLEAIRDEVDDLREQGEIVRDELTELAEDLLQVGDFSGLIDEQTRLTDEQIRISEDVARLSRTQMRDIVTNVRQARTRDRLTHLDGMPVGSVVQRETERTDTLVRFTELVGVVTPDGNGLILNENLVQVTPGVTIVEQFQLIEAQQAEAYARIDQANQAIATETSARTASVNAARSEFNQNISAAESRSNTYADGVRTYANQTFSTTSQTAAAVSAAEIRQQTYADGVRTYANQTFSTISQMGSAIAAAEIRQQTYSDGVRTYANQTFSTTAQTAAAISAASITQQAYTDALETRANQTFATTSAMGTAISQAELRQQTYSDGVRTYANSTFSTTSQTADAISAASITQQTYTDALRTYTNQNFTSLSRLGDDISAAEIRQRTYTDALETRANQTFATTSAMGTAISQAEIRQQTYSDGIRTYADQTFRTAAQVGAAIAASEISQRSYTDNLVATSGLAFTTNATFNQYTATTRNELNSYASADQTFANTFALLGVVSPNGTAFILDTDRVMITPTLSMAYNQELIRARFAGESDSFLLTQANTGASQGNAAVSTLQQMGATIGNGSAFQLDSNRVTAAPGELLSTRLSSIGVQINDRQTGDQVNARVDQKITAAIGPGGPIATWAAGVYTSRGALEAVAGINFESLGGIAARASLFVQANGAVGGVFVGINQGLTQLKFQSDQFFFVDPNGGNQLQVLSYTGGEWRFNSNITLTGKLDVKSAVSGSRNEITNRGMTAYDNNGIRRAQFGTWDE